jgi:hypothetical protein
MSYPDGLPLIPDDFSPRKTSDILDRVKLLIAPAIPGCTLRRFDYPIFDGWSPIELCLDDGGPLPRKLCLSPDSYYCMGIMLFGGSLFLRDTMNAGLEFMGGGLNAMARLDSGPAAIAEVFLKRLASFDLASAMASMTIERKWADRSPSNLPNRSLSLGLCGVYLGEYNEAESVLRDCVTSAREVDDSPEHARFAAKSEAYLTKLTENADSLRRELIATMETNWSHFKPIDMAEANARS